MERQTIEHVPQKLLASWRNESWKHNQSKKKIAEQCFSNYRTIHNALVLGLASKKTQAMLTNYFESLNNKK